MARYQLRNNNNNNVTVCGSDEKITVLNVGGESARPSDVVADMMKAAGKVGMKWMTDACNGVVKDTLSSSV